MNATAEPSPWRGYRIAGALFLLCALPGGIALGLGAVHRGGDPYLVLSLGLIPVGLLFLAYGTGRFPPTSAADAALKLSIVALIQPPFLLLFWWIMQHNPGFGTAYHFTGMFLGFVSLLCTVLLAAGMVEGRRRRN